MTRLELRLLGPVRAVVDDAPLQVDTRKAVALLAYLAVTGTAHRRERLAALLWPDADPPRARGALRRTLSALRAGLGGRWVVADRASVRLDGDGVWCDVTELDGLLAGARAAGDPEEALARLTEAAALYRGDFLAGFGLRDSPEFDDWQFDTAETLRRDLAGALERLTDGCVRRGDVAAATAHARRWLSVDPLHEPAHRQLMRLYAWSGRREAALRQYAACVARLRRELDVVPLPETVALYEAVRAGRVGDPPRPRTPTVGAAAAAPC